VAAGRRAWLALLLRRQLDENGAEPPVGICSNRATASATPTSFRAASESPTVARAYQAVPVPVFTIWPATVT
jgi:hypothetical protein